MKTTSLSILILIIGAATLTGCAATYQQDCQVYLISEPSGAEIWKEDFYVGKTPYLLCYTATTIEDEQGYLRLPPLVIKKSGYTPQRLEMELDLDEGEQDGYYWEGTVILEKIDEKININTEEESQ
jgi:hypothetical protein